MSCTTSAGGPVCAIVLAGGSGSRFGAPVSKVYVDLGGRPVLAHSLALVDACPAVDDVVVVIRAEDRDAYEAVEAPRRKVRAVVVGGATRQASEWAGIQAAADLYETDRDRSDEAIVLLHDAARPLAPPALLVRLVEVVRDGGGGAIPAIPIEGDLVDDGGRGVDAADLVAVQTPQAFPLSVLLAAYPAAQAAGVDGVDTAETVQAFTVAAVRWVSGSPDNLKVTHPQDLIAAEAVLAARTLESQAP